MYILVEKTDAKNFKRLSTHKTLANAKNKGLKSNKKNLAVVKYVYDII